MKVTEILIKILKNPVNKYLIVFIGFGIWILLFDENNLVKHRQNLVELEQLQGQVEFYKQKIAADKQKLFELQTNDVNLEKFAREQFLMKRADEDIFVIVEED